MKFTTLILSIFISSIALSQEGNVEVLRESRRPKFVDQNSHLPLCSEVIDPATPEEGQCRVDGEVRVGIRLEYSSTFTFKEFEKIVLALGDVERIPAEVKEGGRDKGQPIITNKVGRPFRFGLTIKVPVGKEADYCAAFLSIESLKDVANKNDNAPTDYLSCEQPLGGIVTGSAGVRNAN
jgi:hypothetical protein